jgi:hypothetical protein
MFLRDQESDQRPDFGAIVDELIEISDTMPDSKHTEVIDLLLYANPTSHLSLVI